MKVVILARGKGTRLAPYTVVFPKPLMPWEDIPILEVVIRQLRHHGFGEIILAVGHLSELVRSNFNNDHRFGLNIHYSIERDPLGTAGPLTLIPDLDKPFLVMNGDILTILDFRVLCLYHVANKAAATIATHKCLVKIDLWVVKSSYDNRIVVYIEKPTFDYLVSMGIFRQSQKRAIIKLLNDFNLAIESFRSLDVGCGSGLFLRFQASLGIPPGNLAGIDLTPYRIEGARTVSPVQVDFSIGTGTGSEGVMTGKIFEYLASQKPNLALAQNGVPATPKEIQAGIVVNSNDVEDIAIV